MATVVALLERGRGRDAYTGKHAERGRGLRDGARRDDADPACAGARDRIRLPLARHRQVAIPDAILYKPGKLSEEERALMQQIR